jgi:hypothetical protein
MQSWQPRDTLHAELIPGLASVLGAEGSAALELRASPSAARGREAAGAPEPLPPAVVDWLAQLTLLYGVPTEYLVPDAQLLPVESIRFFHVDRNWLDRLVDGALSVGVHGTRDDAFNEAAYEEVYRQVDARQLTFRPSLRGEAPGEANGTPGGPITGLLVRSVIVSTWPGVEVRPTRGHVPVPILRMDPLSPDVLFCLFDGIPDRVEMIEPGEGLHFGVGGTAGAGTFKVSLRGLGFPATDPWPAGEQIRQPRGTGKVVEVEGRYRGDSDEHSGVIDVAHLAAAVKAAMPPGALGPGGELTPAGFAVQMVRAAGLQPFGAASTLSGEVEG